MHMSRELKMYVPRASSVMSNTWPGRLDSVRPYFQRQGWAQRPRLASRPVR